MNLKVELVADPSRIEALAPQLLTIWTDVSNAGGAVGFAPPVTEEDVRPMADRAFSAATTGDHLVVASIDGRPIGFCFLEHRPGPLFRHWVTIKRLQVHPDLQGRGLGAAILERVHEICKEELGLEAIHLTVRGGTGTEGFYERHGYRSVARIPGVIRVAPDDTRDEIYMIKQL